MNADMRFLLHSPYLRAPRTTRSETLMSVARGLLNMKRLGALGNVWIDAGRIRISELGSPMLRKDIGVEGAARRIAAFQEKRPSAPEIRSTEEKFVSEELGA